MKQTTPLLLGLVALVALVVLGMPAAALASVTLHGDYRAADGTMFGHFTHGDGFHQVDTGGYINAGTIFPCKATHTWSYLGSSGSSDWARWKLDHGPGAFYSWLAFITSSGTDPYAVYCDSYNYPGVINQGTNHGWTAVMGSGSFDWNQYLYLEDYDNGYSHSYVTDWDAIRVYFNGW
jgi:hypothetical protein